MINTTNYENVKGEVSGAFLYGIINAFYELNSIFDVGLNLPRVNIEEWYPYSLFIETIESIEKSQPSEELMFQAGIHFIRAWYNDGPGKEMIHSTLDWIHAHDASGGYNSVVRGGTRNEIGWSVMKFFDEEKGIAVYENVMPLYGKFLQGLFYGGCMIFDDVEYVNVFIDEHPYEENPVFIKTMVTVHFRVKPKDSVIDLEEKIDKLELGDKLDLDSREIESLIWRYKSLKISKKISDNYNRQINSVLAKSISYIQELSITDGLTNLFNRRYFDRIFPKEINLSKRKNQLLCFAIMDVDFFKLYNDTYGHLAGDQVLISIADVLKKHLKRADDYCFRLGGEEFGIMLHTESVEHSLNFFRTILKAIENMRIAHKRNKTSPYVTVSIGVACEYADKIKDGDDFYKQADELLYKAKENGRNRVEAVGR